MEESFRELIGRIRKGDELAAAELVRRYEPVIRRAVRFRLTDARLRRTCDSMDVCQSVLASFFVRAALGQYDLDTPEQLLRLLTTMARNKLLNQSRQEYAARRDNRLHNNDVAEIEIPAMSPGPSQLAEARELLAEIRRRLSPEELRLLELRNQNHDWNTIAELVGGNAVALRQKMHRTLERLSREFGLEAGEDA
ncbi:MAG: sigma-70 family RNA polymerase sigma factor [Planctomycetia bacterium]|nr:sigma-70 family RNA polymerase sigma factor [Planctomycetia bacterium]